MGKASAVASVLREEEPLALPLRVVVQLRRAAIGLAGWRRSALAFALGALSVAALPPLHLWIALVPAFTGLVWTIENTPGPRAAFVTGWWFGLGHFTLGLYWIANALLTKPEQFGWLAPPAVLGLAAVMAVYPAAAAALTRFVNVKGTGRVLFFAAAWVACEWVRGWALTGFPWNLVGTVWSFSDAMIQVTAAIGTYGLGLLTVVGAAMPAVFGEDARRPRRAGIAVVSASAVLLAVWVGGLVRLEEAGPSETVSGVRLRLVQPNIPQNLKWDRALVQEHLLAQARMGAGPADPPPNAIVWAEAAAPLFLTQDPESLALIGRMTPPDGLSIVGTLRATPSGEPLRIWNSLHAIDNRGRVVATYDKSHLVPFGEYVPFRSVLDIANITRGYVDFSSGSGITTLRLPELPPVSPLICYEAIFPGRVVDRRDRPAWMLNLTNDGWYGRSSGPYQHFASAKLRAVEEGLPLVRVANTGISAIVDPYGRVIARLGLRSKGVVDGTLPKALESAPLYARFGNGLVLVLIAVVAGLGLLIGRR